MFGSEELSALSPPVAALAPSPYIAMNGGDLHRLGAREGELLDVRVETGTYALAARLDASLPAGIAGVFAPYAPGLALPSRARITRPEAAP